MEGIMQQEWFGLYAVPLLICLARIIDVTLGTIRIIFVSKGLKYLAPLLGFFEITIWVIAIGQVMQNLDNFVNILAYSTGFSLGNLVGIMVEGKIALGTVVMRIITKRDSTELVSHLRKEGFNVTALDAESNMGQVSVLFMNIKRSKVKSIVPIIYEFNPRATYTVEDVRHVSEPFSQELQPLKTKNRRRKSLYLGRKK